MAVTLSVDDLRDALRLNDSAEETKEATRLLAYASEVVVNHAPRATDIAHNEATRRLAGYFFDQPEAPVGDGYSNALRSSGAGKILLPYRIHRAGLTGAIAEAQAAVGTVGNPVTNVEITGADLVVTFADGSTDTQALPSGGTGTVDQTARDAAATAQTTAQGAQADATANESMLDSLVKSPCRSN